MSAMEGLQLMASLGVFSGGFGLLKWGMAQDRRITRLEARLGIDGK